MRLTTADSLTCDQTNFSALSFTLRLDMVAQKITRADPRKENIKECEKIGLIAGYSSFYCSECKIVGQGFDKSPI